MSTPADTEPQLSPQEIDLEMEEGRRALVHELTRAARRPYSLVHRQDFEACVRNHLSAADLEALRDNDVYFCHACGRFLKSRTPVPESVIHDHERHRRALLWRMATGRPLLPDDLHNPDLTLAFATLSATLAGAGDLDAQEG